jgi:ADP-L-glycero-D-manno-heptose 6-epimerase
MIVVTGAAGFIGSNLLAALEASGADRIVACDRLRDGGKWRNIAKRTLDDIIAPDALLEWMRHAHQRIACVFHMGAISATTATDGDLVVRTNFELSKSLWQACAAHGIPFIYASSAAVYGDGGRGFADSNDIAALRGLRPMNLYGWSKWLFDAWVLRSLARGEPAPPYWAGLRFFNVFGPNEYHKGSMQSLVPKLIADHRKGVRPRLFKSHRSGIGDGEQARDFICVDDVVSVMLWLHARERTGGILNLGTGTARTFRDLATAAIRAAGREPDIEYIDMPAELRNAYQYYTCADMTRLRQLGYEKPFTPLEDGVSAYVRDFLLQDDPFR